jgi:hypothetical protein
MKPYKSSSDKENCSPVSSNCVIWQGPDISCINLCKGDSVSDIVYKLGQQICDFQNTASLSDLQLNCILDICTSSPKPELTLAAVLQLIIDKICCSFGALNTAINNINTGSRTSGSSSQSILNLPPCLQYVDPTTGITVTSLALTPYVINLANQFCALKETVSLHSLQITNLTERVTALETAPCCYTPPTVTPNCTYGTVTEGIPTSIPILLGNLDYQYCQLRDVLGSDNQLVLAASSQCTNLGALTALSQPGTMSSLPGWNNTVSNVSQSMQNLWITVCDIRGVVNDLRDCCGSSNCSAFFLGYTSALTATNQVTLTFNAFTVIPIGYSNCPVLSTVTITDNDGHTYANTLDLVAASTNPSGVVYDVTSAGLNAALPWTITVTGCIVNDAGSCSKIVTQTLTGTTTTTTTTIAPCLSYDILIDAGDLADATGNTNSAQNGKVFVSYIPCSSSLLITAVYDTAGPQTALCINSLIIPTIYYLKVDATQLAASTITPAGAC